MSNGRTLCRNCRHQQSVLAGTLFHRTHLPLQTWFRAMWHVCAAKNGLSALNLQRQIGLGSYNTAWLCLHKLRRAMVRPGRERLTGVVEVDEAYVGGPAEGKRGRGAFGKQIVLIAVERKTVRDARGRERQIMGRARVETIPDVRQGTLERHVERLVAPGRLVVTDGWSGYDSLERKGYGRSIEIATAGELADIALPNCHLVCSLMKRWILGTLQGSVGKEHQQDYLNEFVFRFNRRSSRSRGLLFYRLMELAVSSAPVPRKNIIPQHIVVGWLNCIPSFSNHWKTSENFFQSLENPAHFSQPLEKNFPTIGKLLLLRKTVDTCGRWTCGTQKVRAQAFAPLREGGGASAPGGVLRPAVATSTIPQYFPHRPFRSL